MTREKEILNEIYFQNHLADIDGESFIKGAEWADKHPKPPWIKITEKIPPHQEPIIIVMKNKNKEDGIWLYDLCMFFGGDYTDNNNWEGKVNWEIPIYWMPIPKLPKE